MDKFKLHSKIIVCKTLENAVLCGSLELPPWRCELRCCSSLLGSAGSCGNQRNADVTMKYNVSPFYHLNGHAINVRQSKRPFFSLDLSFRFFGCDDNDCNWSIFEFLLSSSFPNLQGTSNSVISFGWNG